MARGRHGSDRITLILVPEDVTARPRRFQIPRLVVRHGPWGAAAVAGFLLLGFVDYVRLRAAAVDVDAMREQTALDEARLARMGEELEGLEAGLVRLQEFERKVRVIADLPSAMPELAAPAAVGGEAASAEGGEAPGGRGGDDPEAPDGSPPVAASPPAPPRGIDHGLDDAAVEELRAEAVRLATHLTLRGTSYAELVEQLEGKSLRLASTPSISPTEGWVTSSYGHRISPFTGRRHFHSGLDIAADFGTAIVAPARGRVTFAGRNGALGKTVEIDHGFGTKTRFGHAAELFVKRGEEVERGQRIAAVGSSGRSTGPHVHYSVVVKGRSTDPSDYILD